MDALSLSLVVLVELIEELKGNWTKVGPQALSMFSGTKCYAHCIFSHIFLSCLLKTDVREVRKHNEAHEGVL